ncbi:LamG-like jellyroll fold domain-containing protein, partial [Phytohabitans kaempferiae]
MSRRTRLAVAAGTVAAATAGVFVLTVPNASAATLFSANFESGSSGWSKSGGDWSLTSDGSQTFQQSNTGTDRARQFAGDTGWTNYSVQGRVKPLAFGGSGSVVALASRVSSSTKMYRLALTNANRVELQYMNGSSVTVLAGVNRTVSTGTWYTLRIDTSGSTISGYVDGSLVGSATNTAVSAGRIGLFTGYASARFDDISVNDSGTTPPTTPPPTTGQPTTPPPTTPPPTTPPPSGSWPTPTGQVNVNGTISVSGTLDGGMRRYCCIGDGGQEESQD